jgi:leucyl aminopeptidase
MNVRLHTTDPRIHASPLLVLPVYEGGEGAGELAGSLDEHFGGAVARAWASGDARGRTGESVVVYRAEDKGPGPRRLMLLGAGKREKLDAEQVRRFVGRAVRAAERLGVARLMVRVEDASGLGEERLAQAAAEGAMLAMWSFRELKSSIGRDDEAQPETPVEEVEVSAEGDAGRLEAGLRVGLAVARGQNLARTLQSRPGNQATPSHLAEEAARVAAEVGLECRILGPAEIREERMSALLAVNQGSDQEPRVIVLEHRKGKPGEPPLALVGKGLTFDAGGISIKPAQNMEDMKFDMSGGASVIGAMRAIAELELPVNVVGVIPSTENLLSGKAMKPGDVIRTRSGKTVEVINTDAEGRLILCDALDYARTTFSPAAMVDIATLTGSVVIALGSHAAAVLGNDQALIQELLGAGDSAGERCWQLPLWEEYKRQLRSPVADLSNVGGRPAGSITAAYFLSEFAGDTRWAHLDIAGTAYGAEPLPYQRKGGYGFPTRLLVEWVRSRAG